MLKIINCPTTVAVKKTFSITGKVDPIHIGRYLLLNIDNQISLTGPLVTETGSWEIDIAFRQAGNHRIEITLDCEKNQVIIQVINEILSEYSGDIVLFYLSQKPNFQGRMIDEIWSWDYQKLEYVHNYIQWLFPTLGKSRFNPTVPTLNSETIQAFRTHEELKLRLFKSFKIMLKFYGLECNKWDSPEIKIIKSEEYQSRKNNWITKGNHNYLRITRIISCLNTLGLNKYARAFFQCLTLIYQEEKTNISSDTFMYWQNAIK